MHARKHVRFYIFEDLLFVKGQESIADMIPTREDLTAYKAYILETFAFLTLFVGRTTSNLVEMSSSQT